LDAKVTEAKARAEEELAEIQAVVDAQGGGFQAAAWDWDFYAEQVRKAKYDLDEAELRPYFEFDRVLRDGVFYAAERLFGIAFKERYDIPVWAAEVRVFEIANADGSHLALFYTDYFKRDNKRGGAWMSSFVRQSKLLRTTPVVYNVGNFARPAAGEPALISFDDVVTMFHEFGHTLHGIFSEAVYPALSGTSVPRDFVEAGLIFSLPLITIAAASAFGWLLAYLRGPIVVAGSRGSPGLIFPSAVLVCAIASARRDAGTRIRVPAIHA